MQQHHKPAWPAHCRLVAPLQQDWGLETLVQVGESWLPRLVTLDAAHAGGGALDGQPMQARNREPTFTLRAVKYRADALAFALLFSELQVRNCQVDKACLFKLDAFVNIRHVR